MSRGIGSSTISYMKVLLHGKNSKNIAGLVQSLGFEIVTENPDVVISYGGDGTLLSSEREYPGIPKLPIRNSQLCNKCTNHADEHLLSQFLKNKLQLKEYKKLHTSIYGKDLYALNDFVVRNSDPTHTIRFRIQLPSSFPRKRKSIYNALLIGDGIVVATPFGSSGYFKSITGQTFEQGFGFAFNNTTQKIAHLLLKENDLINFQLIRGKALLSYDNSPDIFHLAEGTKLSFELSDQVAKIYQDSSLRCPNCQVIRG